MAASVSDREDTLLVSQSPKKRKAPKDPTRISKKKRRQDEVGNGIQVGEEVVSKKDKKKRKEKNANDASVEHESERVVENEDIELPDADVQGPSQLHESLDLEQPFTNGAHFHDEIEDIDDDLLQSAEESCFHEKRLSLQVPIPAISLATPTSSLLSLHLAPLLLTYFPPADGIVLSFSDPVLSARPAYGVNLPLKPPLSGEIPRHPFNETFARCADAYGVCWIWLTATFLVFGPQPGDKLKGWTNVTSEGFVGLVSYNYFQTAIGKSRIPRDWQWTGAVMESAKSRKKTKKGRLRDETDLSPMLEEAEDGQDMVDKEGVAYHGSASFVDSNGQIVPATHNFRVVDVEMVPGHERGRWTLQIDGSLLPQEEEEAAQAEEHRRFEQLQTHSRNRSRTPGTEPDEALLMSGAISPSRQRSLSRISP